MDEHRETFRTEANELLVELESCLLELEQTPEHPELVAKIFRAMHTIKGSGAMFGFDDIAAFVHEAETIYELVRDKKIPVNKSLIDLTLTTCDQIKSMLDGSQPDEAAINTIISDFKRLNPEKKQVHPLHRHRTSLNFQPQARSKALTVFDSNLNREYLPWE